MGPADEGHGAGAGTSLLPQPDAATTGARTFEDAFAAVEQAAQAAEAAVRKLATATRRLRKAAQEGNITAIRRDGSQLTSALAATGDAVTVATASWPFAETEEGTFLTERYAGELRSAAAALGLNVTTRDEALVCSPSIIRLLPDERALRIDGKKRAAIRPSRVAADLHANQQRAGGGNPQRFLEALFKAFRIVCGRQPRGTLFDSERLVTLNEDLRRLHLPSGKQSPVHQDGLGTRHLPPGRIRREDHQIGRPDQLPRLHRRALGYVRLRRPRG